MNYEIFVFLIWDFRCSDLTYADLSALTKNDLELFGVSDQDKQVHLVSEFSTLTNQEQSLKK